MFESESGLIRATTMTNLVFGSDYSKIKAGDIVSSFENDPRLVKVTKQELFETPIIKLAARYGLVSSNCEVCCLEVASPLTIYLSCRAKSSFIQRVVPEQSCYSGCSIQGHSN